MIFHVIGSMFATVLAIGGFVLTLFLIYLVIVLIKLAHRAEEALELYIDEKRNRRL
jgi:hypothetical protein